MLGVPYARLRGFPKLFATYCENWERLAPFYGGDWRDDASYRAVANRIASPIPSVLADALARQNERWHNAVGAQISELRKPGALAVVTGQQVGLFGGPLYTLYKAITAVKLADRLSERLHRPVVPVFWMEGGDHDLAEVSGLSLPLHGRMTDLRYRHPAPEHAGNLGSVGSLVLQPDIDRIREALAQALPATEFRDHILAEYLGAYHVGATFTDAFARTMASLMRGQPLVLMNPEDPAIKALTAPLFERALLEHGTVYRRLEAASRILERDYHAQVKPRSTTLFYLNSSGRNALRPEGDGFSWRGSQQPLAAASLIAQIRAHPSRFSPNVVLRPLVQDTLLPTVAYVAGPGEVSYFAQFKALYEWARVAMPVIYPRASITVVESREQRVMRKHDLDMAGLQDRLETLLNRLLIEGSGVEEAFARAAAALNRAGADLAPAVAAVDPTLSRTADSTRAGWIKSLDKLKRRVTRAEKRKHDTLRSQLGRARQALFPGGRMQERTLPAAYYLAKYGPSFLDTVQSRLSLQTASHQALLL